jgi:DNA-binding CsgD family transcriptional regulator
MLAEAEIGTERLAAADETLKRLGDVDDVPYLYLQVARLRGWLAERRDDAPGAMEIYEAAAGSAVTTDDAPFYRAMLNLAYGRLLRTTGQRHLATKQLQSASDACAVLGAVPLLRQCTEELALGDMHTPRQRRRYTTRLSDREREIAQFVGLGKTNREISAELFISAKTVEYHLANIYLKLNMTGRRELRDLIQRDPGEPA